MTLSGTSTSIISPVSTTFHCRICVEIRPEISVNSPTHMQSASSECMPRIVNADTPPARVASHAFAWVRSGGCYQIQEFGPGPKVLVDLIRDLVAKYKLFV